MRGGSRVCSFVLGGLITAGLFVLGTAWAQPGIVMSNQKISDTAGGFSGILDNLDELGGTVAHLGDLDGAGPSVAAMAIGAALDDDGGSDRGAVYILFLAANGTVLSHQKISNTVNFPGAPLDNLDEFGSSVAFLGDLDGAGPAVAAIAVGAVGDDDAGAAVGAVYILFLSSSGTVLSVQKISETVNLPGGPLDGVDEFGGAVASLGDLDGAGPSAHAIAVGAIGDDDGGGDRGAVYILFLNTAGVVGTVQKISDTVNFPGSPLDNLDDFGTALASLGDLDGAGPSVCALAAGAAYDDDGGIDRGAVYILFLDLAGTVLSSQKISDTQGNFLDFFSDLDEFGGALTDMGDLDGSGDGVRTLAVGVAGDDDNGEDKGAVHMLFLNPDGSCRGSQKISDLYGHFPVPLAVAVGFGSSVAWLGDLDGPGGSAAAVAVGATGDDDGGEDRGAAYILFLEGGAATFTLTYAAGPNGVIAGTSPQVVSAGGSGTPVTAVPNTGYHFASWSDAVLTESRTDTNVMADLSVAASFEINQYTLTYVAGPNGTISGVSPQTVSYGASGAQVTAVPDPTFQFMGWSDGVLTATRTDAEVASDVIVTANFAGPVGVPPPGGWQTGLGLARPNPLRTGTSIPFSLREEADVRIDVWDLGGRRVRELVRSRLPAGDHRADWDGRDDAGRKLSIGTYFYRLMVDGRLIGGAGKALLLH